MFLWLLVGFWLVLAARTFRHPSGNKDARRMPPMFASGWGWLKVETEALNDFPTRVLDICRVLHYPPNTPRFRNPKSFDDDDGHDHGPHARLTCPKSRSSAGLANMRRFILNTIYDFGAVLCMFGVLVALIVLVYLLFSLIALPFNADSSSTPDLASLARPDSQVTSGPPSSLSHRWTKRVRVHAEEDIYSDPAFKAPYPRSDFNWNHELGPKARVMVQLAIPGLTLPLSTIPTFVIALAVSQIFHEAGHALTAALNSVLLQSVGFYIWFPLIPVFYVKTLAFKHKNPLVGHDRLTQVISLRIATAGIWHNILLASISWFAWNRGLNLYDSTVGQVFWRDLNGQGVIVAHIKEASPLQKLLNPKDMIVQIDDISLQASRQSKFPHENSSSSMELWDNYFMERGNFAKILPTKGWCFSSLKPQTFLSDCCEISYSSKGFQVQSPVCFKTMKLERESAKKYCLHDSEMVDLMQNKRCLTSADCPTTNICIEPAVGEDLVRIQTRIYQTDASRTLFYRGVKNLLHEEVRVTHLMPRYDFISANLILTIHEFLGFVVSLSLGLAFMNLLPLKNFDGSVICQAIISFISSSPLHNDLENWEGGMMTDLNPIGHIRPDGSLDGTISNLKEIEHSFLFKFLSLLSYILEKIGILNTNYSQVHPFNNSPQLQSIGRNQAVLRREKYFQIIQRVTIWISCLVFLGLLILEL